MPFNNLDNFWFVGVLIKGAQSEKGKIVEWNFEERT